MSRTHVRNGYTSEEHAVRAWMRHNAGRWETFGGGWFKLEGMKKTQGLSRVAETLIWRGDLVPAESRPQPGDRRRCYLALAPTRSHVHPPRILWWDM